jgi:hypothetical protein
LIKIAVDSADVLNAARLTQAKAELSPTTEQGRATAVGNGPLMRLSYSRADLARCVDDDVRSRPSGRSAPQIDLLIAMGTSQRGNQMGGMMMGGGGVPNLKNLSAKIARSRSPEFRGRDFTPLTRWSRPRRNDVQKQTRQDEQQEMMRAEHPYSFGDCGESFAIAQRDRGVGRQWPLVALRDSSLWRINSVAIAGI